MIHFDVLYISGPPNVAGHRVASPYSTLSTGLILIKENGQAGP